MSKKSFLLFLLLFSFNLHKVEAGEIIPMKRIPVDRTRLEIRQPIHNVQEISIHVDGIIGTITLGNDLEVLINNWKRLYQEELERNLRNRGSLKTKEKRFAEEEMTRQLKQGFVVHYLSQNLCDLPGYGITLGYFTPSVNVSPKKIIKRIEITSEYLKTPEGIQVGTPVKKVLEHYGVKFISKTIQGGYSISYPDRGIEFEIKKNEGKEPFVIKIIITQPQ